MSNCPRTKSIFPIREALRGDANWGDYLHNGLVGAGAGAAGGAAIGAIGGSVVPVAGTAVGAGAGALTGAIEGGIMGSAGAAVEDLWYNYAKSDEQKASWQAGDVEEALSHLGQMFLKSVDPKQGQSSIPMQMAQALVYYGQQYKQLVDGIMVPNSDTNLTSNAFNGAKPASVNTPQYQQDSRTPFQAFQAPTASTSRFRKVEAQFSGRGNDLRTDLGVGVGLEALKKGRGQFQPVPGGVQQMGTNQFNSIIDQYVSHWEQTMRAQGAEITPDMIEAARQNLWKGLQETTQTFMQRGDTLEQALNRAVTMNANQYQTNGMNFATDAVNDTLRPGVTKQLENAGKGFFTPKNLGKGLAGFGAGMVGGMATDYALNSVETAFQGGDNGVLRNQADAVKKMIEKINQLSQNNSTLVAAGQQITSLLDRALGMGIAQPAPTVASNGSKFRRVTN